MAVLYFHLWWYFTLLTDWMKNLKVAYKHLLNDKLQNAKIESGVGEQDHWWIYHWQHQFVDCWMIPVNNWLKPNGICRGTEHRYIQFVHPKSPRCIVWQDKLYMALQYSCNIYLPFHHVKNIIPIIFAKEKFTPHKYSPSSPSPSLTAWAEAV